MLGIRQCEQVKKLSALLEEEVELIVRPGESTHPLSDSLWKFAMTLSSLAPNLHSRFEQKRSTGLPHLQVQSRWADAVYYAALPLDHEWHPFLDILQAAGTKTSSKLSDDAKRTLDELTTTIRIEVFITPVCPHCGQAVKAVNHLALFSPRIESWVIDASQFMDLAEQRGIRSTPTLTVGGNPCWVGALSESDLLQILSSLDKSNWAMLLQSLLASGHLEDAMATIQNHPEAAGGLIDPLMSPAFSVRLAAMRVLEETATRDSKALGGITPALCDLLKHGDSRVRGDVAYALGMIGDHVQRAHCLSF